jgi:uncharacterized protein YutE (UPF0331/DUF86 family)
MVKIDTVLARLAALNQYLGELEQFRPLSRAEFSGDLRNYRTVERDFQLAAQAAIDIGTHILAADFPQRAQGYREVLETLGQVGVLPGGFAERFAGVASFRNVLIHEYLAVDLDIVYDHLENDLDDFRLFARYVTEYLQRSGALETRNE